MCWMSKKETSLPNICNACINVKPEGGGGPQAYVGHLTSIAFPILRNLTENLGPRVGTFALLHGGMTPGHIIPCACLCADTPTILELK